ncbi:MAG TPA: GerMN domain-containing protein [Gaiellaceae bacterium]|nr:GerMN domain-containing protein [Gaiellaceae bacterium]
MKALLVIPAAVLALSLGFVAASCGAGDGAESAGPVPSVEETEDATTEEIPPATTEEEGTDTEPEPTGTVTYQVWFQTADGLFVTYRTEPSTPRVGTAALEALLAGPNAVEEGNGLSTSVPEGTQLLGLTIEDGIASVDLTSEYESGGGTLSMQMRLAQVVFTLTQFPTVDGVTFSLDGEPIDVLGGEGIIIDHPLTRRDYADLLPAILVTAPTFGQEISTPLRVRGSANVFEANVTVRLLDEDGDEIASTFTTATCGSGCRGTYRVSLPFGIDGPQEAVVVVQDDDADGDGRPSHEVRIPVLLVPSA